MRIRTKLYERSGDVQPVDSLKSDPEMEAGSAIREQTSICTNTSPLRYPTTVFIHKEMMKQASSLHALPVDDSRDNDNSERSNPDE